MHFAAAVEHRGRYIFAFPILRGKQTCSLDAPPLAPRQIVTAKKKKRTRMQSRFLPTTAREDRTPMPPSHSVSSPRPGQQPRRLHLARSCPPRPRRRRSRPLQQEKHQQQEPRSPRWGSGHRRQGRRRSPGVAAPLRLPPSPRRHRRRPSGGCGGARPHTCPFPCPCPQLGPCEPLCWEEKEGTGNKSCFPGKKKR